MVASRVYVFESPSCGRGSFYGLSTIIILGEDILMLIKIRRGGKVIGEYPVEAVRVRLRNQSILPTDEYWTEGMSRWESVSSCKSWTNFSVPLELPPVGNTVAADPTLAGATPAVAIQGKVLEYDSSSLKGMISADSGARYGFSGSEWRSRSTRPKEGVQVEFVPIGAMATGIYAVKSVAPVTTGGARPAIPQSIHPPRSRKSRGIFVLLAFFVGCFGVHNFYAGYTSKGKWMLIVGLIGILAIIPLIFTAIVALIDIFNVTEDAYGVPFD